MQGIFFDLDNTLIDRARAFEGYLGDLARRLPDAFGDPRALDLLRELDDSGYRSRPDFCALAVERFGTVWGTPAEVWRDFASGLTKAVTEDSEVVALVHRLRERYTLAVVTNGSRERQREKLSRAGLDRLFETVLISDEVGSEKPERQIFERALSATGIAAKSALFVGDDPERDIAGAAAVGLRTCWISHGRIYPAGPPLPLHTVDSLRELEQVL